MNASGAAFSSRCASRVSSLPFVASSPIDSSPTRGASMPKRHPRVDAAHHRELQQVLRPALDARADVEQHRGTARASESSRPAPADRRPAACRTRACAAITVAPVWPALKSAAASPRATSLGGDPDRRAAACAAAPRPATRPSSTTSRRVDDRARGRDRRPRCRRELGLDRAPSGRRARRRDRSAARPPARRRRRAAARSRRPSRRRQSRSSEVRVQGSGFRVRFGFRNRELRNLNLAPEPGSILRRPPATCRPR